MLDFKDVELHYDHVYALKGVSLHVNQGETGIVEITYSGNPVSSGFGSFAQTTHNGDPIIWTLSEPYGAKEWWPCVQDLKDKFDSITVSFASNKLYIVFSFFYSFVVSTLFINLILSEYSADLNSFN